MRAGKCANAYGGFHKWGIPTSWMVSFMENPTKTDDLGVNPF